MPKPKLSLRDLFAVVTIVALALGWWVDHRRQEKRYDLLVQVLRDDDGHVQIGSDGKPIVVWTMPQRWP